MSFKMVMVTIVLVLASIGVSFAFFIYGKKQINYLSFQKSEWHYNSTTNEMSVKTLFANSFLDIIDYKTSVKKTTEGNKYFVAFIGKHYSDPNNIKINPSMKIERTDGNYTLLTFKIESFDLRKDKLYYKDNQGLNLIDIK